MRKRIIKNGFLWKRFPTPGVTSFNEGVTRGKALVVIQDDINKSKTKAQLDKLAWPYNWPKKISYLESFDKTLNY